MIRIKDKDYLIIDGDFYHQEPIPGLSNEFKLVPLTLEQKAELFDNMTLEQLAHVKQPGLGPL